MNKAHLKPPNDRLTVYESLLSETQIIDLLGLTDRPNPKGSLRWLIRKKSLPVVRIGKGILRFRPSDVARFIDDCAG